MAQPDYKDILLKLIATLTLSDHMGDAAECMGTALDMAGIDIEWGDLHDLRSKLGSLGVTTLYGSSIADEED